MARAITNDDWDEDLGEDLLDPDRRLGEDEDIGERIPDEETEIV